MDKYNYFPTTQPLLYFACHRKSKTFSLALNILRVGTLVRLLFTGNIRVLKTLIGEMLRKHGCSLTYT